MSLGEKLAALRKSAELTQNQLGEKLNLTAQAISKWEKDLSQPDIATLQKLSSIYNIPIDQLLEGDSLEKAENEAKQSATPITYSLVCVGLKNPDSKILSIKRFMDITGCGLAAAKHIIENSEVICYGDEEECAQLGERLDENGIAVSCEPCYEDVDIGVCTSCGAHVNATNAGFTTYSSVTCKKCQNREKKLIEAAKREDKKDVKKLFVWSNVTAAIPAILWMILGFIAGLGDGYRILLDLAAIFGGAYIIYSFIFQLWYMTPVRWVSTRPMRWIKAWKRICFENSGLLIIFNLLLYVVGLIPLAVLVVIGIAFGAVLAPFLYPFSIRRKAKNLKEGITDTEALYDIAA